MGQKNLLKNVYLFKTMDEDQLAKISDIAELKTYGPGEEIFSQHGKAEALYVINYGSVRIYQKSTSGDNIEVAILGSGSHFGEMAFVDGEERSATAEIMERSDLVEIPYQRLQALLDGDLEIAVKFFQELAHFLVGRLRVTTNDLSFAREKNLSHF